jgi:hypothetical protein
VTLPHHNEAGFAERDTEDVRQRVQSADYPADCAGSDPTTALEVLQRDVCSLSCCVNDLFGALDIAINTAVSSHDSMQHVLCNLVDMQAMVQASKAEPLVILVCKHSRAPAAQHTFGACAATPLAYVQLRQRIRAHCSASRQSQITSSRYPLCVVVMLALIKLCLLSLTLS